MSSNVKITMDYTPRLINASEHNSYRVPQETLQQSQYNGSQLQYSQVTYNSREMENSGVNSSTRHSNLTNDQTTSNNNNNSNNFNNSNKYNPLYLTRSQCDSNDGSKLSQTQQQVPLQLSSSSTSACPANNITSQSQQIQNNSSAMFSSKDSNKQTNINNNNATTSSNEQQQQVFKQNYRVSNTYRPLTASAFPLSSIPLVADYSSLRKQQQLTQQKQQQIGNNQQVQQQHQSAEINSGLFEQPQQQVSTLGQQQQQSQYQYNSQVDRRSLQSYVSQTLQEDHQRLLGSQLISNQLNNRSSEGQQQSILKNVSQYQQQYTSDGSYLQQQPFINNTSQYLADHNNNNNNNLILRYTGNHSQYDQQSQQQQTYQPLSYLNNHNHIGQRFSLQQQLQPKKIESSERLLLQQQQANSSSTYSSSFSAQPSLVDQNKILSGQQQQQHQQQQQSWKADYSTESPLKYCPNKDTISIQQQNNNNNMMPTVNVVEQQTQPAYQATPFIKQNFPYNSNNLQDLGINRKQSHTPIQPIDIVVQDQSIKDNNNNNSTNNNNINRVSAKEPQRTTPLVSLTLLPIERQSAPTQSSSSQQQQQQFSYQKDQQYSSAMTATTQSQQSSAFNVQSTPDRKNTQQSTQNKNSVDHIKDPSEMFLIRDQDTGQVYDIRTIDKLDQFSQTNNQEYFDKLKRRHKNVWQGWWSSKKENNIKFLDSVRCNDCALVEALLQQDLGDLKPDIDYKDPNHLAAIHYAAMNNSSEMLSILIAHEADIEITDSLNQTPIMIAAERGYTQIIEICLKSHGDPNKQDINLNSSLHLSCKNNHKDSVRILLNALNIDITLRNIDKKLPIECTNDNSIVQLFSKIQKSGEDKEERTSSIGSNSNQMLDSINSSPLQASIQSLKGLIVNQNASTTLSGYQASHTGNGIDKVVIHEGDININNNRSSMTTGQQNNQQQQQNQGYHGKGQSMLHHRNTYEPLFGATGFYSQKISFQGNHSNVNNTNNNNNNSLPGSMSKQYSQPAKTTMTSVTPFTLSNSGIQLQQVSTTSSGIQQQQTTTSNGLNIRSSNKKSQDSDSPQTIEHTQSMSSSTGSTHSPQNVQSSNNNNNTINNNSDYQSQQPWRVIIHDFTNESVLKMFNQENNSINDNPFDNSKDKNGNDNNNNNIGDNNKFNNNNTTTQDGIFNIKTKNINDKDKDLFLNRNSNNNNLTNNNSQSSSFQQSSSPLPGTHHKVLSQDIFSSASSTQTPLIPQQPLSSNKKSNSMQQQSSTSQPPKKSQKSISSSTSQYSQFKPNIQQVSQPDQQIRVGPESFRIVNQIGRGSFGEVYLVEKRDSNGQYFAMKMLHKSKVLGQNLTKYAMTERNVLSIMSHPFIVKLMYAFQTSKDLFLIMQYMPGGDLSRALQRDKRFTENRARIYLAEILLAIRDLHKHDIIYRDLKPENIVIDSEGHANLTDFGLSKDGIYDHYSTHSFCGSLAYLAPEMLKRCGHGKAVDYYHLGVLLYEMLTGAPPFFSDSKDEICHNIEFQDIRFPSHVSDSARNLISRLLVKNPAKRLGFGKNDFEEIKKHPFFQSINWNQAFQRKLKPPPPYIKPIVDSKNNQVPNFMVTMTPAGMITENHISGWSFINTLESLNINGENNNNSSNNNTGKKLLKGDKTKV